MKTKPITKTLPKLIGYYNGDEWGSDGWWEEGNTSEELMASAQKIARSSGFDAAPDLTEVELAKLSELSKRDWMDLWHQWRLSRRNSWTSKLVDAAIEVEEARRNNE